MKISSLRNIKTQALLVYLKTICSEYFEEKDYKLDLGVTLYNNEIKDAINFLSSNFSVTIWDVNELCEFIKIFHIRNSQIDLPYTYKALVFYYNALINEFEANFRSGDKLIPEIIIFSLLSEWIFEEEKSIAEYSFLKEIDYVKLLGYFELARNNEKKEELRQSVKIMYMSSSKAIKKLKNSKFKIDRIRKSNKSKNISQSINLILNIKMKSEEQLEKVELINNFDKQNEDVLVLTEEILEFIVSEKSDEELIKSKKLVSRNN